MNDSIGLYLNDIGKVPLLTAEDERELSRIIEAGREAQEQLDAGKRGVALKRQVREAAKAKDRFIRSNLRLVVYRDYCKWGVLAFPDNAGTRPLQQCAFCVGGISRTQEDNGAVFEAKKERKGSHRLRA